LLAEKPKGDAVLLWCVADQRRILFYKKIKCYNYVLLSVLAKICHPEILSITNKYNVIVWTCRLAMSSVVFGRHLLTA